MVAPDTSYDVFISYSHADAIWVWDWLRPRLEAAGLRVCLDRRDFDVGVPSLENMERAVDHSRHTLLVLTPAWVASEWTAFEELLTQTADPAARRRRLLPLLLQPCQPPRRIAMLTYADLTQQTTWETELQRIIAAVRGELHLPELGPLLREQPVQSREQRNRQAMLEKVRTIWITGVLQRSLVHEVLIELDLAERLAAVEPALELLIQRPDCADRVLPPGTQITNVFDEVDRALLILGAPGAGKTTLLLTLAHALLQRAAQDPELPIPVVFPLSSWATRRRSLADWLVDALNEQYDVPRKIGQAWVEGDQVLPLLDGLDEVASEHRAACVETINAFRQDHGLLPLVVCSRAADYEGLGIRLRLQGALVVQPLTPEQVDRYLMHVGAPLAAMRHVLQADPTLWELLETPLMLTITTLAYMGQPVEALHIGATVEAYRQHLFTAYVDRMFQRRSAITRYPRQQTERWLAWLAWQLTQHSQTVFYLERMQPDWLPQRQRWLPTQGARLVAGLVGGLVLGLAGGLIDWWMIHWLVRGLVLGLLGGLIGGLVGYSEEIMGIEIVRWSWSGFLSELFLPSGHKLRARLGAGFGTGLVLGLLIGLDEGLTFGLYTVLTTTFSFILVSGLGVGLGGGPVLGLLMIPLAVTRTGLGEELNFGLAFGLLIALVYKLSVGFAAGLSGGEITTKTKPNEGIHRSARIAVLSGIGIGLVSGLLVGLSGGLLLFGLGREVYDRLLIGLYAGFTVGLATGIKYGGRACLQHLVLRLGLRYKDFAPWQYVDFLDHAAERLFLRKVGGGYSFIHGLLQDYFATRYMEPGRGVPQESTVQSRPTTS